MTIVDRESFGFSFKYSDYIDAGLLTEIARTGGTSPTVRIVSDGPLGDNYLQLYNGTNDIARTAPSASSRFFIGMRINRGGGAGGQGVAALDPSGAAQITVTFSATGAVNVNLGDSTLIASSAAGVFPSDGWHYFEFGGVIDGTAGVIDVRVDGVSVPGLSLTGINTKGSSTSSLVQSCAWTVPNGVLVPFSVAHYYFCDSAGAAPWNTFLGDVRVQRVDVSAAIANQWSSVGGAVVSIVNLDVTASRQSITSTLMRFEMVEAPASGSLTALQANFHAVYASHVQFGLYADSGGAPGGLLASSAVQTGTTAGVNSLAVSGGPVLVSGTPYWIGLISDGTVDVEAVANIAGQGAQQAYTYAGGLPSAPAATVGTSLVQMGMTVATASAAQIVSERVPSTATGYQSSSVVGQQDTFSTVGIGGGLPSVLEVAVKVTGFKSDAGTRSLATVLISGAATAVGSAVPLAVTNSQQVTAYALDPDTGGYWTPTTGSAARIGYKISA